MGRWCSPAGGGRSGWGYFNNDIGGDAMEDARTLKSMVRQMTSRSS